MRLRIEHRISYTYSEPVWLEPMLVRLRAFSNPFQRVQSFTLNVNPEPAGRSPLIDAAGNSAQRVWFEGTHRSLEFFAVTEAETFLENPYGFLLEPGCTLIPLAYPESDLPLLQAYFESAATPDVAGLARRALERAGGETVSFLLRLAEFIHAEIKLEQRLIGDPYPPEVTLQAGVGACRDLARLYAEACRSVGVASRFVSGYARQPEMQTPELHAWCEVYLPGAGWRGFDPSTGLAVDSSYLALAAGPTHHEARPTWGNYRGPAQSRLRAHIRVEML